MRLAIGQREVRSAGQSSPRAEWPAGGYIEYAPGEFAWRGVNAAGYMFIHCIWIHAKQYQRKGWGSLLVASCVDDAKKAGMSGVAALVREGPWMADRRLFLGNRFEVVDTAPPDYELVASRFDHRAAAPSFRRNSSGARYGRGLTIIRGRYRGDGRE